MCPQWRWRGECCPVSRPVKVRQKVSLHRHCYGKGPRHCQPHQLSKHTGQDAPDGNNTLQKLPETKGQMTTCHTVTSPHLRCYITTLCPGASMYCWPTFVNTAVLMQSGASGVVGEGVWKGDDVHQMLRLCNYPPGATCCSPAVWDLCKERQSHTEAFVAAGTLHEMLSLDWVD